MKTMLVCPFGAKVVVRITEFDATADCGGYKRK